jgi:sugar-specific transcriptional regulator TrmB
MVRQQNLEAKIRDLMKKIGFSENEIDLYIALLKSGEATIAECVQSSNVKRATAYNIMGSLINSGLVFEIQDNPKRFAPVPPKSAFETLQQRRLQELESEKEEIPGTISKIIEKSEILSKQNPLIVDDRREFMLLRGTKMMNDIMIPLAKKVEDCQRIMSRFPLSFPRDSQDLEKRRRLGISPRNIHVLFETGMLDNQNFLWMIECDFKDPLMQFRHLESLPIKLVIFDNFAGVVTTPNNTDRNRFESILTYNRNVVEFYISSFDSFWDRAKVLTAEDIEERIGKR